MHHLPMVETVASRVVVLIAYWQVEYKCRADQRTENQLSYRPGIEINRGTIHQLLSAVVVYPCATIFDCGLGHP